ncbi:hypothetical protein EASAB2608_06212 [Streptomyces sp. EAS-AB2608]|uniref:hypothetical protein n=1 Tax=Streptomyces sp. EAS-AB2608 TaxID=2779671 RepID=UPI001BED56E1|nr:hypothetical protein [Streptomyces sp. EAS-AB2608]BCM70878.1 hypothetical protein EASAB2608_06212 [Streptomyces sp. EAS-AB2608]
MSESGTAKGRAKQVQLHVEDLLVLMNASKIKKDHFQFGGHPIPLKNFDKAEAFTLTDVTHSDVEGLEYFTDTMPADLDNRVNCAVLAPTVNQPDQVAVRRYLTVRRPLLPVKTLTRHVVASQRLFLDRQEGVGRTSVAYFGTNGGTPESWMDLASGRPLHEAHPDEWASLRIALGVQFGRDYLWYAHLKSPGGDAGVMIPTTPEGARALFRLRDCEPGASRRKALIHWVSEHSRRIRKDTTEETRVWVHQHMRGTAKFKWQDMEGAIYPAPYDLRRIEQARP